MIPIKPPIADKILIPIRKTIIPMINAKNIKPKVANIFNQLTFLKKNICFIQLQGMTLT